MRKDAIDSANIKIKKLKEDMKNNKDKKSISICQCTTMKSIINKRKKFNKAFNLPMADKPADIKLERRILQFDLMLEELREYLTAHNDLTETADAITDMFEILLGIAAEHGMLDLLPDLYNEVHKSNMSKLDKNGKAIYREDGKVLKGENYFKPDIKKVLSNE